jgi:integrase/recombinase XerC
VTQAWPAALVASTDPHGWVETYLGHITWVKRLAPRTCALYRADLLKLMRHAQQLGLTLEQLQSSHVRQGVARLHAGGHSPRGVALVLSGWRGLFKWLAQQGRLGHDPTQGVRAPKVPRPLPKALPVDEAVRLTSHTQGAPHPVREARDAAMVELLYGCGLRLGELLGLDVAAGGPGWLDLADGTAHVTGKGSKRRSVPLGKAARVAVQHWLALRPQWAQPNEPALFINAGGQRLSPQQTRNRLRQRALAAGLEGHVHPHMLRHSFASHLLQSSGDLRGVQELLGHASIQSTQIYTRLDAQHLAAVYDAAHPRAKKKPAS